MIKKYIKSLITIALSYSALININLPVQAQSTPLSSANGKYDNLIQILNCPRDASQYGEFNDYGYWQGGAWCGQTGEPGYWVWVEPNWYVWGRKLSVSSSVNGKYSNLIQILNCPNDRSSYGEFNDYGYWQGGAWCGQTGKPGYWVWVDPNWYVWQNKR